mmetsp:Transcript_9493/g.17301  ORF Transcript_9493/g.17301 Transcript_9493/m.17301 type:complete len:310 (+) Transcript_9493:218-1147(+)
MLLFREAGFCKELSNFSINDFFEHFGGLLGIGNLFFQNRLLLGNNFLWYTLWIQIQWFGRHDMHCKFLSSLVGRLWILDDSLSGNFDNGSGRSCVGSSIDFSVYVCDQHGIIDIVVVVVLPIGCHFHCRSDSQVFSNGYNSFLQCYLNRFGLIFEGKNRFGSQFLWLLWLAVLLLGRRQGRFGHMRCQFDKGVALSRKIRFGRNLDHGGHRPVGRDGTGHQAFRGVPSRQFFGCLGGSVSTKPIQRLVHIAVGFCQRLFAIDNGSTRHASKVFQQTHCRGRGCKPSLQVVVFVAVFVVASNYSGLYIWK